MNQPLNEQKSQPKVFIVEDETMLAMLIEIMLEELSYATASHASSLSEGLKYAQAGHYDLAILDVNIIGGTSFEIAVEIARRGIPFIFCTGYGRLAIPETWADRGCVAKPFSIGQLGDALNQLLHPDSSRG
jgi:DNA-binding response OmpR family regulator